MKLFQGLLGSLQDQRWSVLNDWSACSRARGSEATQCEKLEAVEQERSRTKCQCESEGLGSPWRGASTSLYWKAGTHWDYIERWSLMSTGICDNKRCTQSSRVKLSKHAPTLFFPFSSQKSLVGASHILGRSFPLHLLAYNLVISTKHPTDTATNVHY